MTALTVCQPYAHLIAVGEKAIENRTWATNFRGQLAIHAGKSRAWLDDDDERRHGALPFGAIVAVAWMSGCRAPEDLPPLMRRSPHANGPVCWMLSSVVRLPKPITCKGARGLWRVPDDVEARVVAMLGWRPR